MFAGRASTDAAAAERVQEAAMAQVMAVRVAASRSVGSPAVGKASTAGGRP